MRADAASVAFLDRDGTINRKPCEGDYVKTPAELELLPGAAVGIRVLRRAGFRVVVVTNQRGIARGIMSEEDLAAVHSHMLAKLRDQGASVDAIYYCPHEAGSCDCRKPRPGLLLMAAADLGEVSFERSVLIGDAPTDIQAGRALGARTVLIGSEVDAAVAGADFQATSLDAAARLIAERFGNPC